MCRLFLVHVHKFSLETSMNRKEQNQNQRLCIHSKTLLYTCDSKCIIGTFASESNELNVALTRFLMSWSQYSLIMPMDLPPQILFIGELSIELTNLVLIIVLSC